MQGIYFDMIQINFLGRNLKHFVQSKQTNKQTNKQTKILTLIAKENQSDGQKTT